MPTACGEAPEIGFRSGRVVEMEGLRIELRGEGDHLLTRYRIVAERGAIADIHVIEIFHGIRHNTRVLRENSRFGGDQFADRSKGVSVSARPSTFETGAMPTRR